MAHIIIDEYLESLLPYTYNAEDDIVYRNGYPYMPLDHFRKLHPNIKIPIKSNRNHE